MNEFLSDAIDVCAFPGKGRGLAMNRSVEPGELLFVSRAFAIAPVDSIVDKVIETLHKATPAQRRAFSSLHDGSSAKSVPIAWFHPTKSSVEERNELRSVNFSAEHVGRVVRLNAHSVASLMEDAALEGADHESGVNSTDCGLWLLPSMVNHDCTPSAICVPVDRQTLAFVAAHRMDAGDEITDTYVNLLQCLRDRQQELSEQKGFECHCGRCLAESAALPDSVVAAQVRRFQVAHNMGGADDFLRAVGSVRRSVSAAVEAVVEVDEMRHMLRASLLIADVGTVIVYESPQCTQSEYEGECAKAALQVCLALEQVAPLSKEHLQFAERHMRHSSREKRRSALIYLFVIWLLRFGSIEIHRSGGGSLLAASAAQCRRLVHAFLQAMRRPASDARDLHEACDDGILALLNKAGADRFGAVQKFIAPPKCCDHVSTAAPLDEVAGDTCTSLLDSMD